MAVRTPAPPAPETVVAARWVVLPLIVVTLLALGYEWQRGRARLTASYTLRGLESAVARSLETGSTASGQLQAGVLVLRKLDEEGLDPSEVAIPMALGSHYLLLQSPDAAIRWYEAALSLETRPEILINLARAHRMAGDEERAQHYLEQARALDPLRYKNGVAGSANKETRRTGRRSRVSGG